MAASLTLLTVKPASMGNLSSALLSHVPLCYLPLFMSLSKKGDS